MRFTKTLLTTALLGVSLVSFSSTAWAITPEEQFQQGFEAAEKGDYQTAFNLFKPLAEKGYSGAQATLGFMYRNGHGVKQNNVNAAKWYRKAAEQGHDLAQLQLAEMYVNGVGVKQSDVEAVKWLRKSAEQGNADAQANLGIMYGLGRGVKQNENTAKKWIRKSCNNGNANACNALADLNSGR